VKTMTRLAKRETRNVEPVEVVKPMDLFGPIDRTFERMFDMWPSSRWPMTTFREWLPDSFIKVDEFRQDGSLVIRAELPGIDPDKDVELTVSDGTLHITAERHQEEKVEKEGYVRQELQYGSFERALPLPEGVSESEVTASYKDGILEIRVPTPQPEPAKKIPISTS